MKYIKLFENKGEPQVGDYIYILVDANRSQKVRVEKIVRSNHFPDRLFYYLRKEDDSLIGTENVNNRTIRYLTQEEIEDFEMKIAAKKYNL